MSINLLSRIRAALFTMCAGLLVSAASMLFIAWPASAQTTLPSSSERISNFHADILIYEDGSAQVTETITYDFGDAIDRHGIIRTIPSLYITSGSNASLDIAFEDVVDENGMPYTSLDQSNSYEAKLRIGDADITVNGEQTYVITYTAAGVVNRTTTLNGDMSDELYWNVTGTGWDVPIDSASATIHLPFESAVDDQATRCFTGITNSNDATCTAKSTDQSTYTMATTEPLDANEGLTVVAAFTSGVVTVPAYILINPTPYFAVVYLDDQYVWNTSTRVQPGEHTVRVENDGYVTQEFTITVEPGEQRRVDVTLEHNIWFYLIPFISGGGTLLLAFLWWAVRGRFPRGRGTVVPQYQPHEQLNAAAHGALVSQHLTPQHIVAGIIQLAVDGYITIVRKESKRGKKGNKHVKKKSDKNLNFQFRKKKKLAKPTADNADFQASLYHTLFGNRQEVSLAQLRGSFGTKISKLQSNMMSSFVTDGLTRSKRPTKYRNSLIAMSIIIIVGGSIAAGAIHETTNYGPWGGFAVYPAALFLLMVSIRAHGRTAAGMEAKEYVLGLKRYLRVAEKARLEFHDAPELHDGEFQRLLPYAVALGVEQEWAGQFHDELTEVPWAEGMDTEDYNHFVRDIGRFAIATAPTLSYVRPSASSSSGSSYSSVSSSSSASSGSSGISSGTSGGGFGGGGGSSW